MAYSNTGTERAKILTVNTVINNVITNTSVYDIRNMFIRAGVTYNSISDNDLSQMSANDYITRLNAFCDYIESINPNFVAIRNTTGSSSDNVPQRTNETACPIGS